MNKIFCCCIIINRIIIYNFRTLLCLTCLLFAYFQYTKLTYVRFLMCFCKTQKLLPFGMYIFRIFIYIYICMYVTHVCVCVCVSLYNKRHWKLLLLLLYFFYFINNCRRSLSCSIVNGLTRFWYEWIVICMYVCVCTRVVRYYIIILYYFSEKTACLVCWTWLD